MPKPPARIPAQARPDTWRPPPPSPHELNKEQADEFFAADRAMHTLLDELDELDKLPDGGDKARRDEIHVELRRHTDVLTRSAELLGLKMDVALEQDMSKMNRADRRRLEARLRKKKGARAQATSAAARKG